MSSVLRELVARSPVALLVGVAALQLWLVVFRDLTPWCGGGFGMFSTLDARNARVVRAMAHGEGWQQTLEIPPALADQALRAAVLPSDARLERLARALAPLAPDDFDERRVLRLTAFTTGFDPVDLRPRAIALRSFELLLEDP